MKQKQGDTLARFRSSTSQFPAAFPSRLQPPITRNFFSFFLKIRAPIYAAAVGTLISDTDIMDSKTNLFME